VEQRLRNPVVKKMSSVEKKNAARNQSLQKNSHEGCDGACKVLVAVIQLFY
jgi:hypothetical protein